MAVTAKTLSAPGGLTFAVLRQYAQDQLEDRGDAKAVRRAGRIVNAAARFVAKERNWSVYLRRHRIILRPRIKYTDAVSMSAEGRTLTLLSGEWDAAAAKYSFRFDGDTEVMRILSRDSSTALTTWSNDIFIASANNSGATGFLVRERYELPDNFKSLASDPHQKDFFGPDGEIPRTEMLHLNQTYTPSSGSPINYTYEYNQFTARWELLMWQWPDELRSMDMYIWVYPDELVNDADVLVWDINFSDVQFAAIQLKMIEELRRWDEWPVAYQAYKKTEKQAAYSDKRSLASRVAGQPTHKAKWMQLNRPFTSE